MMKKVVLVIVLLALVVGVSYIKTVREHDRSEQQYKQGMTDAGQNLEQTAKESDSLRLALADQQLAFADSLLNKDKTHRTQLDSLEGLVEQKDETIKTLTSNQTSTTTASVKKSPSKKALSKHEQILSYYKKRFARLPKDLSE